MERLVIAALLFSASTAAFGAPAMAQAASRDNDKCSTCTETVIAELKHANVALTETNAKLEKLINASQATPSAPEASQEDRRMVFRGDNPDSDKGNWGILTTNTSEVKGGPIVPIGHLFRNADAVPAEKYFAIWENDPTDPADTSYIGVTYARTLPKSSGKLVGYVAVSQPLGGGVAVNIAESCDDSALERALVDPSTTNGFLGCKSVRRFGWIAK